MKIPLYHKDPLKLNDKSNEKSQPSAVKNKNKFCEIENTLEIQLNSSNACSHLIPYLLLSWLPMLLLLLFIYSTVTYQIESQKVEVANLKTEVKLLNREVLLLKEKISLINRPDTKDLVQQTADEGPTKFLEQPWNFEYRSKRDTSKGMSNYHKGFAASERKLPNSSTGRRGKQQSKRRKNVFAQRRRQCRRCLGFNSTSSGFQAVHFKGSHPETIVEAGELCHVGPWIFDPKAIKDSRLSSSFKLREDGESVEVDSPGLYFIYAQVYYLTSHALNSFTIKLVSKDSDSAVTLAYCSSNTGSMSSTSEVSCFTAALHTLQVGDRIYVQSREKNRRLIMRPGHSFLGLIKFGDI